MKTIQWLAAAAAVSMSLPVFATTQTFTTTYDFTTTTPTAAPGVYNPYAGGSDTQNGGYGTIQNDYGNKLTFGATTGSIPANSTVTVTAYASTGPSSGTNATSATVYGSDTKVGIDNGIVTYYSGNGLAVTSANGAMNAYGTSSGSDAEFTNCSGSNVGKGSGTGCKDNYPDHAMDNMGAYEALLLSFNSKVKLTSLTIGFPTTGTTPDSDATVLYYTGSGVPPLLTNYSFASLLSSGLWAVANGSLYDLGTAAGNTGVIANPVAAQYFLVGAYIPLTGETANPGDVNGKNPDYIKLKSISTTVVPEPSTLALFGIAGGALVIRRRRSARAV